MSPWARPVYGGGLYLYGHDSGSPLIKISNADSLWVLGLLYNEPEWAPKLNLTHLLYEVFQLFTKAPPLSFEEM